MAAARVEADLAAEKLRMEAAGQLAAVTAEADSLAAAVRQLKDELAAKGEELEFLREELQAKKEELEEVCFFIMFHRWFHIFFILGMTLFFKL
jgi:hypothetical protein